MSSKYDLSSLEGAQKADCAYCWTLCFLNGPGNNKRLLSHIEATKGLATILTETSLENLKSIAGEGDNFRYKIKKEVVSELVKRISSGWNPPPLIVTQGIFDENLSVSDGNHRLEALKQLGIEKYWVVFLKKIN